MIQYKLEHLEIVAGPHVSAATYASKGNNLWGCRFQFMVVIGNFLFRYRNGLFPVIYSLLLFRSKPVLNDYRVAALMGLSLALAGQSLRAVTIGLQYIIRGGRAHQVYAEKLVEGGVFAHCRNPLYLGNFVIVLGVGIASNSLLFVSIAIPFFAFAYLAIIAAEENYLQDRFGRQFDEYCGRVNRLIPKIAGLRQTLLGTRFNWRRLITAEYGSTYYWLGGICLVTLRNVWLTGEYHYTRPIVLGLWCLLATATIGYVVARILKKRGLLVG